MSIFPGSSVSNYKEMLSKLSWYTGFAALICILILQAYVPPVKQLSAYIDGVFPKDFADLVQFPISYAGVFILAIIIGLLAHAIKLHDRLSDVFCIRKEFDLKQLLYPLAIASGASLSIAQFRSMRENREDLMSSTFYKYASSTEPKISSHTITQALTNLSWFWVCLEAITLFTLSAVFLMAYNAWQPAALLLTCCAVLFILMWFFRSQTRTYAERQVRLILDDNTRRMEVTAVFNAL